MKYNKEKIVIYAGYFISLLIVILLVLASKIAINRSRYVEAAVEMTEISALEENLNEIESSKKEKPIVVELEEEKIEIPLIQNNEINQNEIVEYYIKVNCEAQVVNIYGKNSQGDLIPVRVMLCSTGTYTPDFGIYEIKSKWRWLGLQGDVYGQYCTQITGNILFHSVPYTTKYDQGSLEYWEFDKLGIACSLGCIRLMVRDAKWIYENISTGTKVEFYYDVNPGPLGKPDNVIISGYEETRGWDPSDPSEDNPWNK